MRKTLLVLAFLAIPVLVNAQQTSTLRWDHPASTPAQVATFNNLVVADGTIITTAPTCTAVGTSTTCSVPIPLITNGQHVYSVRSIINGVEHNAVANVTWPAAGSNQAPTVPRIVITVTVNIGSM